MSDINYIKSYLVKLGVDVSSGEITKWDNGLKQLEGSFTATVDNLEKKDKKVKESFTNTFKSLIKGYTKVATAFTSASIGIGKFMQSVANSDMETQKFARSMYLSVDQAKALQNTLNSMDLSMGDLRDVAYNPELLRQYKEFLSLAKSFKTTPEMKQSFKEIRAIFAEFQKFNLIFQSFKERLTHFIYQTIKVPAQKLKEFLSNFNTRFAKNISNWAEKLGIVLGNIMRIGLRVYEIITSIISSIGKVWDKLSGVSKGIIGAIFLINRIIKGSPIWGLMTAFTGFMMLLDDYKTYKEGGISAKALKPLWEKIEDQRNRPDSAYSQLKILLEKVLEVLNTIAGYIIKIVEYFYGLAEKAGEKVAEVKIAADEYGDYARAVGTKNVILSTISGGTLGISKEQYQKAQKSLGMDLISYDKEQYQQTKKSLGMDLVNYDEELYDFNHNRLDNVIQSKNISSNKETNFTPLPSNTNKNQNITQTFNFNLSQDSMNNPQSFMDEVSMLLRNNKSSLVGE